MPRAIGSGGNVFVRRVRRKGRGGKVVEREQLVARVRYRDADGRLRTKTREVANRTEGRAAVQALAEEARAEAERPREDVARADFGRLATLYAADHLRPAVYRDGRKISGRRSLRGADAQLRAMCAFFGAKETAPGSREWEGGLPLRRLTYDRLAAYRAARLAAPVHVTDANPAGRPRKIASVNREMETLRNMLNVAARRRWVERNPFADGPALISAADETKRKRVLSFEEEDRLLAACVDEEREGKKGVKYRVRRARLRAVVVCALDTAMRAGEIFKLRWRDLDRMSEGGRRQITVQQMNTKTLQERSTPISKRLQAELDRLRSSAGINPDALVFGYESNAKNSFANACRDAGLKDFRFHDLRRTAATRLHRAGMPLAEVSRILGHSNVTTTYRYIGVGDETVDRAAELMDEIERLRGAERERRGGRGAA